MLALNDILQIQSIDKSAQGGFESSVAGNEFKTSPFFMQFMLEAWDKRLVTKFCYAPVLKKQWIVYTVFKVTANDART